MKMDIEVHDHKEDSVKGECLIDIKGISISSGNDEKLNNEPEQVCRICHFGRDESLSSKQLEMEMIQLGCDCKGGLGSSHRHCAQAWFQHKGDRLCEICGKTTENINTNNGEETSIFMLELNEMRMVATILDDSTSRESEISRWCNKSFCNILLACLVLTFLLTWFFRWVDIF